MTASTTSAAFRILIVEDEMLVAMSIEDALTDAGYQVVGPATTVDRAQRAIAEDGPLDAAILDMNLNGQSGLPIADMLAERGIPFLVLSGYGASALGESHKGTTVIAKPFDPDHLVAALGRLVEPG